MRRDALKEAQRWIASAPGSGKMINLCWDDGLNKWCAGAWSSRVGKGALADSLEAALFAALDKAKAQEEKEKEAAILAALDKAKEGK